MHAFAALLSASWRYSRGRRGRVLVYLLLFIAANIVLLLEPVIVAKLLNIIQQIRTTEQPLLHVGLLLTGIIAIQFAFWGFHGPARVLENLSALRAKNAFADELYSIVSSLSVQWHKDHHSGQTINRMRKATSALNDFMSNGFQLVEMVMRLLGSIVALALIFPGAALIATIVTAIAMAIVFVFDRVLLPQYDEINEYEHRTASALHDYVTNMFTVISLRLETLTKSELWKRMHCYLPLFFRNNVVNETKWFLTTVIISLMTALSLLWYALITLKTGDAILVGTVYLLYDYLQKIGNTFYTFAWKYSTTIQQYADLRAARHILDNAPVSQAAATPLPMRWQQIAVTGIHFSYEDETQKRRHLENVSITLERGKRIALVGESGSGKSTLLSILRGLHTPERMTVTCDGTVLTDGLRRVAGHVTLMPQEPEIFNNTIEYNISVDTEQSSEEILRDVDVAQFTPVLARLPAGLKTDIAEKGVNLSGGEKQRLAVARGVFAARSSDIILLDEPTSSVDPVNELLMYEKIFSEFADRCIVSSIHRLHLLRLFDHVIVMQEGRIVEEGAPHTLLQQSKGILAGMMERMENVSNSHS